ncbi:hypothetical protein [Micromonospora pallida]|nr:hypothetical protein [Micromonospora pallida]
MDRQTSWIKRLGWFAAILLRSARWCSAADDLYEEIRIFENGRKGFTAT